LSGIYWNPTFIHLSANLSLKYSQQW